MKIIVIVLMFVAYAFYFEHLNKNQQTYCAEKKTVAEIGGCGKYYCGVKYTDGTFGHESLPVVGQMFCKKYKSKLPWRYI
jgi:hypothetical protein